MRPPWPHSSSLPIAVVVAGCGQLSSATELLPGGKLDVVGYSTPEAVYQESLEPAFKKTSEGEGVSFSNSFGASGDQSRAVEAGSARLRRPLRPGRRHGTAGRSRHGRATTGTSNHYNGIAQDSVVVFSVRKGNPKDIQTSTTSQQGRRGGHPEPVQLRRGPLEHHGRLRARLDEGKSEDEALEAS